MKKKVAFIFPGQGAQYVGMGEDFYDEFASAKEVFHTADEILNFPLKDLIFNGPADELTETKNAQVAIYVTSMAILAVLHQKMPTLVPTVCAGLSLGEYTALTASDRIDFVSSVKLVRARGLFMQEAGEKYPGTMAVVLGMTPKSVATVCDPIDGVWVANLNCPGQVVISGTEAGVSHAGEKLKEAGAKRVLPLQVSGAFHSGLMQEAQDRLKPLIDQVEIRESAIRLAMNVPGGFVADTSDIRKNMAAQVTSPVRWEDSIREMTDIDLFIEIGCGKTLAGMNKKIGVEKPTITIEKVEDLEKIYAEFAVTNR